MTVFFFEKKVDKRHCFSVKLHVLTALLTKIRFPWL